MDEDSFALLLQRLHELPFRFLTPRAPHPVEVRREERIGASWYSYDGDQERFRRELDRTEAFVLSLLDSVEAELALKPRHRVLLGFSQGGYCGSYIALRHPERFSGLIVSGARVKTEFLEDELPRAAAAGFAALLCHGERDTSVSPESAERSRDALASAGIDVRLETFDAGHSVGRLQVDAFARWLTEHGGA
jgi:predicted esterase